MVYDATWVGRASQVGLTSSWIAGGALYRALGRLDHVYGARSWEDALAWLCSVEPSRPISEVQYWGHGRFGRALIARDVLDKRALDDPAHPRHDDLAALRDRLTGDALVWFRTCETFGRPEGHAFAAAWTRFFERRAAGHTYVIGPFQSGLHSLSPGQAPSWSVDEGVGEDGKALMSSPGAPHTITCLHGAVPAGW